MMEQRDMEEKNTKRDGSGLLKILIIIIFILTIIYIVLGFDMLKLGNKNCNKYINPLNILYVSGTNEWASDCKRIKVENFEVDVREYSFDNGKTWQESNVYTVCQEGQVLVKIRDANQKILGEGIFNVSDIDSTPPTLEIPGDITVKIGTSVDLKEGVRASDNESGLNGGVLISPSTIDIYKAGETTVSYSVSDKAGNKITKTRKVTVTGTLNVTSFYITPYYVNLKKGNTYTLKPVYYPSDLPSRLITWSSSNTKIATVDNNGVITAVSDGTAYITGVLGNKKAAMTVVVGNAIPVTIYPTSVSFSTSDYTIKVGESLTTKVVVTPSNAIKSFTYKSANNAIATYTNGVLKGVSVGQTTITVATSNGKVATARVNVVANDASSGLPTSIIMTPATLNLSKGATGKLTVTVLPTNATGYTVQCTSDNTSIATIDSNYNVKGINNGTTVITCKTSNGKMDSSVVVVGGVELTGLTASPSTVNLTTGGTQPLTFGFTPSNATGYTVQCTSANTSIATIGNDHIVHAVTTGSTVITCTAGGISTNINVNVNPKTVTMYRYRDKTINKVDCNCSYQETGGCDYYYDCSCTKKWVCTSSAKGGCPCPRGDTRCGAWETSCGRCCHAKKEYVCSKCTEEVWGAWSEWSTTPVTATSTREVETKQVEQ